MEYRELLIDWLISHQRFLTQRRKGAKTCQYVPDFLCGFAPLRETVLGAEATREVRRLS